MLAFCLFPIKLERALGPLNTLPVRGTLSDGLLGVNHAAAYLRRGEIAAARSELMESNQTEPVTARRRCGH